MRIDRHRLALALLAAIPLATSPSPAAEPGPPASRAPVVKGAAHRFACADYTGKKVFLVDASGRVEWEYDTGGPCNDLWVLPDGNLLFNTGKGVREVTREKKVVFEYTGSTITRAVKQKDGTTKAIEGPSEIYACQRLANGDTFIAECNTGRLLEIAPDGGIAKEIRLLPAGKDGGHLYIRNARKLADGHYLVAHNGEQVVREYDAQGKMAREIPAQGGPHSVIRLPDGNTLVSCGDLPGGSRVFEAAPDGRTVWEVTSADLPGIQLKFMAGIQRLPNGNTVMCNWQGHGAFGSGPHLIEVAPGKEVVWTFSDHQTMRTISSVQILDVPGDATRGEIPH